MVSQAGHYFRPERSSWPLPPPTSDHACHVSSRLCNEANTIADSRQMTLPRLMPSAPGTHAMADTGCPFARPSPSRRASAFPVPASTRYALLRRLRQASARPREIAIGWRYITTLPKCPAIWSTPPYMCSTAAAREVKPRLPLRRLMP